MKAYKIELLVIDMEGMGIEEIKDDIKNSTRYTNPNIMRVQEAEIGEWTDEHPLNRYAAREEFYNNLFNNPRT